MPTNDTLILLNTLNDPYNHGLVVGRNDRSGCFFHYGEGATALEQIVQAMQGECTRRESIPSVFAQENLFKLCVEHYGRHADDQHTAKQQEQPPTSSKNETDAFERVVAEWKGAVVAHLLMEDLLDSGPTFEHRWQSLTLSSPTNLPTDEQPTNTNQFIESILDELPENEKNKVWNVFLIKRDGHFEEEPLMQRSNDLMVIPAANLNGFAKDAKSVWLSSIPWLIQSKPNRVTDGLSRVHFTDPLGKMTVSQLLQVESKLGEYLAALDESNFRLAFDRFLREVVAKRQELQRGGNVALYKVEDTLLEALLLRDALEQQLIIKSNNGKLQLYLHQTRLAVLDDENLLTLENPYAYIDSPDYEALYSEVNALMKQTTCHQYVKETLENSLSLTSKNAVEQPVDCPIVMRLKKQLQAASNAKDDIINTDVISVRLKAQGKDIEAQLENPPLSCFNYKFIQPLEEPNTFFSRKLVSFQKTLSTQNIPSSTVRDIGFYEGTLLQSEWYTFDNHQFFLPLGHSGAYFLLPKLFDHDVAERIKIIMSKEKESYHVSVRKNILGFWYELQNDYTKDDIVELDSEWQRPSVGVWPDIYYTKGQNRDWKDFYTYLYTWDTAEIKAEVYYPQSPNDPAMPHECMTPHTSAHTMAKEKWQIAQGKEFPLFVKLTYGQDTVGVIPCTPFTIMQPRGRRAVLAIDFGMSGTVGAILPDDVLPGQRFASILSAGFVAFSPNQASDQSSNSRIPATSGIAWQFNHDQGMRNSGNVFLSDLLNTVTDNNPSGAIFTIIRRFHDAPLDAAKPFLHGNIQFIGSENLPESTAETFSGLKLAPIETAINKANIQLFLRQILEMYWLRCYQEGIQHLDVRFAYPLAMPATQQRGLCDIMYETCQKLVKKTGIELEALRVTNESHAVHIFYHNLNMLAGIAHDDIIVTLDIGGGTTDFSIIVMNNPNVPNQYYYYSTTLAGNNMFAHHLSESHHPALQEQRKQFLSIGQAAPDDPQEKFFILRTDQLLRSENKDLIKMIQDHDSPIHHVLVFELCLLFWTARMLYEPYANFTQQSTLSVCLAGNGSKFYYLLDDGCRNQIRSIAFDNQPGFTIIPSQDRKMEVVKGLTLMQPTELQEVTNDNNHITNPAQATPNTSQDLWTSFDAFLHRYHEVFQNHSVIAPIISDPAKLDQLRKDFGQNCTNFDTLVERLLWLCRVLNVTND